MRRDGEVQATSEALMLDGRWLRISRSPTSDHGFIVLCSDITRMKEQERSLLERKVQLEQVNVQLDLALNNMAHGLCMFDSERRLTICNERYATMYGLPAELTKPGTPLYAILQCLIEKKTFAESAEETFAAINARPKGGYSQLVKSFNDGRLISISYQGTADGGWVAIHEDTTERQKARSTHCPSGAARSTDRSAQPRFPARGTGKETATAAPWREIRGSLVGPGSIQERQRFARASHRR